MFKYFASSICFLSLSSLKSRIREKVIPITQENYKIWVMRILTNMVNAHIIVVGVITMDKPDYKEMYLNLFRASEEALDILIAAQRKCEEMYLAAESETPAQAEKGAGE